ASPSHLRELYAPRSPAATADLLLLRSYSARGLHRVRVHTQVFSAAVKHRGAGSLLVRVVERSYGSAVGTHRCVRLPTSRPVTRTIAMHRSHHEWLVTSVSGSVWLTS